MRRDEIRARLAEAWALAQGWRDAAWMFARRRPDAVMAAGLFLGVVLMILHWSRFRSP